MTLTFTHAAIETMGLAALLVLTNTILPRALGVENAAASDSLRGTLRGWRFGAWVAACAAWAYAFVALLQRFDMGLREGAEYAALLALLLWIFDRVRPRSGAQLRFVVRTNADERCAMALGSLAGIALSALRSL